MTQTLASSAGSMTCWKGCIEALTASSVVSQIRARSTCAPAWFPSRNTVSQEMTVAGQEPPAHEEAGAPATCGVGAPLDSGDADADGPISTIAVPTTRPLMAADSRQHPALGKA